METRNENMNGVQQELLRIIQNDDAPRLLEGIVSRINEIEEAYQRLRQLYETVKPLMPKDSEYNVRYWMSAYILYPKASELLGELKKFKETHMEMDRIEEEIKAYKEEKHSLLSKKMRLERKQEHVNEDIVEALSENLGYYLSFSDSELHDIMHDITQEYYEKHIRAKHPEE